MFIDTQPKRTRQAPEEYWDRRRLARHEREARMILIGSNLRAP
jgi:hypothetical protein